MSRLRAAAGARLNDLCVQEKIPVTVWHRHISQTRRGERPSIFRPAFGEGVGSSPYSA